MSEDPKMPERERLRAAQTAAVMPLIGPLLDAWEGCSQQLREELPELDKQLRRINRAMESANTTAAQDPKMPEPVEKLTALLDDLIDADPDLAERFIEKHLARIDLRKRLATAPAPAPGWDECCPGDSGRECEAPSLCGKNGFCFRSDKVLAPAPAPPEGAAQ